MKKIKSLIIITILIVMPIFIMPKRVFATETNKGIKGDLNNNKVVDIGDILLMLRHIAANSNPELDRSWVLPEEKIKQGDINNSNQIDINDVLLVLRYIAANNNEEIRAKHPEWLQLEDEPKTVEVTSVTLNKKSATIEEGKTLTLTATITPSNSTNKTLTWTSSNNEVATVKDGKVTAKKAGTATITVKTNNGKEDKCKLTVKKKNNEPEPPKTVEVTSITLNRKNIDIVKTKKVTLKATIKPENSTNQKLTWTSSNFNIVTVKKEANSETTATITAKSVGTAEITVTASNGIQATCEVNVKPLLPTKITLPSTKTITIGENQQLNPIITPKNADETRITWSSSNKNIVRVTSFGVIHGGKEGTATITARTENGKIAKCKVTVKKNDISIKNIRINKTSLEITKGNTSNLKAIITPSNATIKKLTWTSSNTKIVTVKKDANSEKTATITAKAVGTAKITVTADGGKTATCIVKVINSSNPSNPTDPSTPSSEDTQKLVESLKYACKFIGKIKYRKGAGGKLENGYSDCSHYVHRVFEHTGVMNKFVKSLKWGYHGCPNTTDVAHFNKGEKWDYSNASPGDVIWEHYSNSSNHVYIYLGNNKRLGCSANHGVRIAEAHKNGQTKYERKIIHFNIFPKAPNSYYDPSTKTIKYK